ncbi:alcohol dehydrogenase [Sistotremastrum niveocremeum HHB9708]|uniref:Alcohol dehydrogenase n=2 Tax=Sistotremastraceae TaxID=3402574 RepID=A0A164S7W3_9AGAM|nr:alcohol dehydrogenase [Sistotremastrum niveocremeum HHB9708]KZT36709.1 Dehydroquinate synthase-like protein [Sistotremastrum suecicum HHB10207 ss-3]
MAAPATRSTIFRLMNAAAHGAGSCPCHGCRSQAALAAIPSAINALRGMATPVSSVPEKEYAFEIAAANLRFGDGVTKEVGMDLKNMKASKVALFTDKNLAKLPPVLKAIHSLETQGVPFEVYSDVSVEPTEASWRHAIEWSRTHDFSHFLAVGGGSVIDTAKAANLLTVYKENDLMDFVNAPIGKGLPVEEKLRPLIAVPTTAGTGSETTGTAILDITSRNFKTGIANRALKPTLGVVDTENTETCPTAVHISSGLDVLFHALESYTAIPYYERTPRPSNPILRPAYQGSNPVADIFSLWALRQAVEHLPRVARDKTDRESRTQMLLASTFAGIGFGNAGVHLCHGMSYPISGFNKTGPKYQHPGYVVDKPIIPHGISVALTGPAVFRFTAPSSPSRHREALAIFRRTSVHDSSISRLSDASVGPALYDAIANFLLVELNVPRGLSAIGYTKDDVPRLVKGTIPQRRVLDLAPGIGDVAGEDGEHHLTNILEASLSY